MTAGPSAPGALLLVLKTDLHQAFLPRLMPPLAALTLLGILGAVMRGDLSGPAIVVLVAFGALDHQFNAMLSRSRTEWEALTLLPVSWRTVIIGKNLATIIAWAVIAAIVSTVILYVAPRVPTGEETAHALLLAWTLLFPLLIVGNLRSLQEPRREETPPARAVLLAVGMLLFAVLCSLPYVMLTTLGESETLSAVYGGAAGVVWWRWSIPHTAQSAQSSMERA